MGEFGIVATVGAGVAINAMHSVQTGVDPFPTLFAGALWMGACVLVGEGNASIGSALALVYLLAVVMFRGPAFFKTLNALTKGSN
jgi:hypothetical protein